MNKRNKLLIALFVLYVVLTAVVAADFLVFNHTNYFALIVLGVGLILTTGIYYALTKTHETLTSDLEKTLDSSTAFALSSSNMGVLVYNEEYEVVWMSSMFTDRGIEKAGEKVLTWLPELQDLLVGKADKETVVINDDKYSVVKKDDAYVLLFNDISREYDLSDELNNIAPVLGLVNFDNFDELSLSEDEVGFVNTNIKVPVMEYLRSYGVVYKTLRNNRLQLVLNKQIYQNILNDRFSILNKVRREAKAGDVDVTLSISFAYGSNNLDELDELASNLLEVAETRGGDQVIVRQVGKDAVFYGGSSEAKERQSILKSRSAANTLRKLIDEASNVIIVGHKDADSDCVGASLVVSLICNTLNKESYIALQNNEVEPMISDVLNKYKDVINKKHRFVSEDEALSNMNDDSLVVMVDHHSKDTSNSPEVLNNAKKIVIVDHHRRKADLDVDALFLYVEAGASSTTEMMVEMFPFFSKKIDMESEEANIMYIGILIDTNHFRSRSDARTFDVAKTLKQYGADSIECEKLIEEPYEMSKKRYEIIALADRYKLNYMIAKCKDKIYPRSIASQAVDMMVAVKEIEAAFVICKISTNEVAISARSDGSINVQIILEKLGGGGHMTAAGLQTKTKNQDELYNELIIAIDEYIESVKENESNTIE